ERSPRPGHRRLPHPHGPRDPLHPAPRRVLPPLQRPRPRLRQPLARRPRLPQRPRPLPPPPGVPRCAVELGPWLTMSPTHRFLFVAGVIVTATLVGTTA